MDIKSLILIYIYIYMYVCMYKRNPKLITMYEWVQSRITAN